jgi:alkanesulfonate monooxygenase SsuD/methylene tetrahydromethanopterin reductase-like flavin-dependent oxidoreductase (luciferase family)
MVPALVTDDAEAGRALAAETLAFYATIPSYQKVIEREGLDSIVDLAAVGDADTVRTKLRRYLDAGATEVALSPLDHSLPALAPLWEVTASL